jgi:mono/diheme cytochrome c family protein
MHSLQIGLALSMLSLFLSVAHGGAPDPRTARAWRGKCAACHGDDGKGQTEQGKKMGIADMTSAAWQKEFTDEKIKSVMQGGLKREKNGKHQEMDSFRDALTPEQIDALVRMVRSFGG